MFVVRTPSVVGRVRVSKVAACSGFFPVFRAIFGEMVTRAFYVVRYVTIYPLDHVACRKKKLKKVYMKINAYFRDNGIFHRKVYNKVIFSVYVSILFYV